MDHTAHPAAELYQNIPRTATSTLAIGPENLTQSLSRSVSRSRIHSSGAIQWAMCHRPSKRAKMGATSSDITFRRRLMSDELYDKGMQIRRAVLGDEYVDRTMQ